MVGGFLFKERFKMNKAEPKGADFLLIKELTPSTNQNKLTVRSGEARQSSQVGGGSFNPTFYHSLRMELFPTPEEKYFYDFFENLCIYKHFEFQKPIRTPQNTYIVDFCIEKHKIIIEIDGLSHLPKLNYDINRDSELEKLNYTVIHFSNSDVLKHIKHCFRKVNMIIKFKHFRKRIIGMLNQKFNSLEVKNKTKQLWEKEEAEKNYLNYLALINKTINEKINKLKTKGYNFPKEDYYKYSLLRLPGKGRKFRIPKNIFDKPFQV